MGEGVRRYVLGAVFARGGSKGIPDKNLRRVAGRSLVAWAVKAGLRAAGLDRLILSTDDPGIAEEGRRAGAEVPFLRPEGLAADDTPEILAWRHAVDWVERDQGRPVDVLVSIPPTAPLREAEDVVRCLEALLDSDADAAVTVTAARRHPAFNMVRVEGDGTVRLWEERGDRIHRRQDAPSAFDVATVAYAVRTRFLRRARHLFEGRLRAVEVPPERAWDIDTPADLEAADCLLRRRLRKGWRP